MHERRQIAWGVRMCEKLFYFGSNQNNFFLVSKTDRHQNSKKVQIWKINMFIDFEAI